MILGYAVAKDRVCKNLEIKPATIAITQSGRFYLVKNIKGKGLKNPDFFNKYDLIKISRKD